jgi:hypothetical protein
MAQPKIARIEAGAQNMTLRTLKRIIAALGGRFDVSISPSELYFPTIPHWWDCLASGAVSARAFKLSGMYQTEIGGNTDALLSVWSTPQTRVEGSPAVLAGQSSTWVSADRQMAIDA